ncbi:MAG: tRNA (N6-isopentenyl adenosine(37)-C2)-methylthiotransferase MiaB [Deltaproteobacteria bacterium]|nr:tRNA (N6-isopentenyl adenosine(37)-C2)-methylthiotransferase MiaB [Deltaproteobacteria bacterium]
MPDPTQPISQPRGVFIQTFGCQMNEYDSAKMLEQLRGENYVPVSTPGAADLILVNTCAVREKAEHKVFSLLGTLSGLKAENPDLVIGVGGCVAQQKGREILRREKSVDLVFGTDALFQLPEMITRARAGERVTRLDWEDKKPRVANFIPDFGPQAIAPGQIKASVAITKGCNNFCTFCVVPFTRGREVSREPENILEEARRLAAAGVKELTLLGQNVNSYTASGVNFVELLKRLNEVPGLERLRYTSPYPRDVTPELARAHRELPKLCEHMHLPVQSGSDRILKAMKRRHTRAEYLEKIALVREHVPEMVFSTDLIVGFPGETEADFLDTLGLMETVGFDQIYAFKFSPRADTPAGEYPDQVPGPLRTERLQRLFDRQDQIVQPQQERLVGTRQEVLLEAPHPLGEGAMSGRTRGNKPVMILDCAEPPGRVLSVEIVASRKFSLVGKGAIP